MSYPKWCTASLLGVQIEHVKSQKVGKLSTNNSLKCQCLIFNDYPFKMERMIGVILCFFPLLES